MNTAEETSLVLLVVVHSVLGETAIIRFAWHLTSVAWFALAAVVVGAAVLPVVGTMSIVSATIIFVMLRGHLAWPLFLLAGLAAYYADGWIDSRTLQAGALVTTGSLFAASGLHVWWAAGGTWMQDRALPPVPVSGFKPGPWLTLAVAAALAAFGLLVAMAALGQGPPAVRWLVYAGVVVLVARAVGDRRTAGFTKTIRDTAFARADDAYFTPLVVFLTLGATGALIVG